MLEQMTLDLDGEQIETQWNLREQEEHAKNTEEARCLQWICEKDSPDWDWWKSLRQNERDRWIADYRLVREMVEAGHKMSSPRSYGPPRREVVNQWQAMAEAWAVQIRQAFLQRKPCPIIPAKGYETILEWAFQLAQIPAESMEKSKMEEEQ